jgi:hypothetical protein
MARKRKRATLPRLTLLAWNKRDLAGFLDAVEKITHCVEDLAEQIDRLKAIGSPRRSRPSTPAAAPADGKVGAS